MRIDGRNALVVGLGRSGRAAARFLVQRGAKVTVTDRREARELGDEMVDVDPRISLELGGHREEAFRSADLIIVSPGVAPLAELAAARESGIEIIGEFELACRFLSGKLVAVTGTNGKSTTTSLIGHLAEPLGSPLFVGGNLGTPLIEAVGTGAAAVGGLVVAEASSFQLETVEQGHAHVAVLMNIAEDHLDRYPTMDAYRAAKERIFLNQTTEDHAIVRSGMRAPTRARVSTFGVTEATADARVEGDTLWVEGERFALSDVPLVGRHNYENVMAALLVSRRLGVSADIARERLRTFLPLPHRMQLCGEISNISFFDDSKATNVASVVASMSGFPRPFVLIAGGRDKGGDYRPLRSALVAARAVVLIGEAREKIRAAIADVAPCIFAQNMSEAVRKAFERATTGDAVVLSPACSSFDMFRDYADRGAAFCSAVAAMEKEGP